MQTKYCFLQLDNPAIIVPRLSLCLKWEKEFCVEYSLKRNLLQLDFCNQNPKIKRVHPWKPYFWDLEHGFKSVILPELKNCQNGTFQPVHEIQKFFWPKDFFWSIIKMAFTKDISNMSQGLPNPGFRSVKVENWDFLKKNSQDFKNSVLFGFQWIPSKTGKQNWKVLILWWFIIVKMQCG